MKEMDRRQLIRLMALTGLAGLCGCASHPIRHLTRLMDWRRDVEPESDIGEVLAPAPVVESPPPTNIITEEYLQDMRVKSLYFVQDFPDDIFFTDRKLEMMRSLTAKFRAVQRHVGHGNFNVLGMDEFFRYAALARGSSEVTAEEKNFLEEMFYFDAKNYGFQGEKVVQSMTDTIKMGSVRKIPFTGHFLRKGRPIEIYEQIRRDVGDSVILTSGVRGLAKQYHLFFEKGLDTKGNVSKASRSLAPPGYSFHGQGDFDIGRRGYGLKNFTDEFARTEEYKKLIDLGYVQIRYTESNLLGVRFEPWHIKVHT